MIKYSIFILTVILTHTQLVKAQDSKIEVPELEDNYSRYVSELESGKTVVDFTDFRHSFLESKMFRRKGKNYSDLKTQVYAAIKKSDFPEVIRLTKAMLSIDYTSLFAHKYLQQTYKIVGDTVNRNKYHDIEFGLLNSITNSGDGKSCETGWHVTQIEEEYFILDILGARLQVQSISSGGKNTCDKMVVKTEEGNNQTYYFEANKVFEMESKLFGN